MPKFFFCRVCGAFYKNSKDCAAHELSHKSPQNQYQAVPNMRQTTPRYQNRPRAPRQNTNQPATNQASLESLVTAIHQNITSKPLHPQVPGQQVQIRPGTHNAMIRTTNSPYIPNHQSIAGSHVRSQSYQTLNVSSAPKLRNIRPQMTVAHTSQGFSAGTSSFQRTQLSSQSSQARSIPTFTSSVQPQPQTSVISTPIVIAPESDFACDLCTEVFSTQDERNRHKQQNHTSSPSMHLCPTCNIAFPDKHLLSDHMTSHAPSMLICTVCQEPFTDAQELVVHMREQHQDKTEASKPFVCEHCKLRFAKRDQLLAHLSLEHPENGYKCNVCDRNFSSRNQLSEHMAVHPEANTKITSKPSTVESVWTALLGQKHKDDNSQGTTSQPQKITSASNATLSQTPLIFNSTSTYLTNLLFQHQSQAVSVSTPPASNTQVSTAFMEQNQTVRLNMGQTMPVSQTTLSMLPNVSPQITQGSINSPQQVLIIPNTDPTGITKINNQMSQNNQYQIHIQPSTVSSQPPPASSAASAPLPPPPPYTPPSQINLKQPPSFTQTVQILRPNILNQSLPQPSNIAQPNNGPQLAVNDESSNLPKISSVVSIGKSNITLDDKLHDIIKQEIKGTKTPGSSQHHCSLCKASFNSLKRLNDHMETHNVNVIDLNDDEDIPQIPSPKVSVSCNVCLETFTSENDLSEHLESHIKQAEETSPAVKEILHKCHMCQKTFNSKEDLTSHLETHNDVRTPIKPTKVDKRTSQQPKVTHAKVYTCKVCRENFTTERDCAEHIKSKHEYELEKGIEKYRLKNKNMSSASGQSATQPSKKTQKKTPQEHKCQVCMKIFSTKVDLNKHMESHVISLDDEEEDVEEKETTTEENQDVPKKKQPTDTKPFKCTVCSKVFCLKLSLDVHMKEIHSTETFSHTCPFCHKKFLNSISLDRHMQSFHKQFVCQICGNHFLSIARLKIHEKEFHNIWFADESQKEDKISKKGEGAKMNFKKTTSKYTDIWRCKICRIVLETRGVFNKHLKDHMEIIMVKNGEVECSHCGEKFDNGLDLRVHMADKWHLLPNSNNKFTCDFCSADFDTRGNLYHHLKNYYYKSFDCYFCNNVQEGLQTMMKHLLNVHQEVYLCKICGKVCANEKEIRRELRRHKLRLRAIDKSQFDCNVCHNVYENELSLYKHMAVKKHIDKNHLGRIECPFCDSTFLEYPNFDSHLNVHYSEILTCYHCNKKTKGVVTFHRHLISVHNEHTNPLCEFCTKGKKDKQDLKNFKQLPYNDKLYQCSKCDKVYDEKYITEPHAECAFKLIKFQMGGPDDESGITFVDKSDSDTHEKLIDLTDESKVQEEIIENDTEIESETEKIKSTKPSNLDLESQFQNSLKPSSLVKIPELSHEIEIVRTDVDPDMQVNRITESEETTAIRTKSQGKRLTSNEEIADSPPVKKVYLCDNSPKGDIEEIMIVESGLSPETTPGDKAEEVEVSDEEACRLCDGCGQEVFSKTQLQEHAALHEAETFHSVLCGLCGKVFDTQRLEFLHQLQEHSGKQEHQTWLQEKEITTPICLVCLKSFQKEEDLLEHLEAHADGSFEEEGDLKGKTSEKNVSKSHGNESKTGSGSLFHLKTTPLTHDAIESLAHVQEETKRQFKGPFSCRHCSESFFSKEQLRCHSFSHRKNLARVCKLCFKIFKTKLRAAVHRRRHILSDVHRTLIGRVATFKCEFCYLKFSCRTKLSKHKEFSHKSSFRNIHRCKFCRKVFKTQSIYQAHAKASHPIKTQHQDGVPCKLATVRCPVCEKNVKKSLWLFHKSRVNCFSGFSNKSKNFVS